LTKISQVCGSSPAAGAATAMSQLVGSAQ
jgi:hypothetical protein